MNTNNPDILFFVRREYGAPSIELRAYKVEKVNNEFAFLELERLRLVVFSGDFQSVSLHHEFESVSYSPNITFVTFDFNLSLCLIINFLSLEIVTLT